jgi:hypothetical protein
MAEARQVMPGGVSSPVRAFKSVGGEPVVFDRVKGSKAFDVDGNEYVDYVGTWGPVRGAARTRASTSPPRHARTPPTHARRSSPLPGDCGPRR